MCPWITLENKLDVASQKPVLSQILDSLRVTAEMVVFLNVVPCALVERY
jgi:DNA polymerase III psi subunit